jgi:hypothetical protein
MATTIVDIVVRAKNQASQALRKPIKDLSDLKGAMAGLKGPLTTAAGAMAVAFGIAAKASAEYIDVTVKAAQKTGLTTEEFSRLAYAARLSDVELGTLQSSLRNLGNGAINAANGTGEAARAYDALGISVKNQDGTIKSNNQLMLEVADRLSQVRDGNTKAALASMIFGKRIGTELIPMLNGGAEGIRQMGIESDKFGQTIRGGAGKDVEAINDNIRRLDSIMTGFVNTIVQSVGPSLKVFSDWLVNTAKDGTGLSFWMKNFGDAAASTFKYVASGVIIVSTAFKTLGQLIGDVAFGMAQLIKWNFTGAFQTVKTAIADAGKNISENMKAMGSLWKDSTKADGEQAARNMKDPIIRASNEIKGTLAEQRKAEEEERKRKEGASKAAYEAQIKQEKENRKKSIEASRAADEAATAAEENYRKNNEMKIQANQDAWDSIAYMADSGNKELSAIGKAAAIRNAIMDAYAAINKTMASVPFPLNIIASAAVGASAFANVAAIQGVAHGGLENVPREGTYLLDEGERVLSPSENKEYSSGGASVIQLIVDSRVVAKGFADLQRKGLIRVALA